jgi:predicted 2-oxoglutarate/Fe(II)-dependent dioxygenase YbiX
MSNQDPSIVLQDLKDCATALFVQQIVPLETLHSVTPSARETRWASLYISEQEIVQTTRRWRS